MHQVPLKKPQAYPFFIKLPNSFYCFTEKKILFSFRFGLYEVKKIMISSTLIESLSVIVGLC
jgi:hypothetical protein